MSDGFTEPMAGLTGSPKHNHACKKNSFATIAQAIEEGRRIGANIVKFVCHLMTGAKTTLRRTPRTILILLAFYIVMYPYTNTNTCRQRRRDARADARARLPRRG